MSVERVIRMDIDEIVESQKAKFDRLLSITKTKLGDVEGPTCNRHGPTFNIANHPYYWEIELRSPPSTGLFGLF